MEQLAESLLGNDQQRQTLQNLVQQYESGQPGGGHSDQEVAQHYNNVAARLPQDRWENAAINAYQRMTPQQRQQFGQWLQHHTGGGQHGGQQYQQQLNGASAQNFQDPSFLAQLTGQLHQQQPGILGQLLGQSSGSGAGSNPIARAAIAGITAMAAKELLNR
ncbi:MAG TPA: hypothetical protein VFA78_00570 [Chloroflexota bacterium]|nr:hypothetical protein [Chloroflexota bacterium]